MRLTDKQEETLDRWLSASETGDPDGDYGNVTILHDNPRGRPQITFGKHQTTEQGKNLKKLIRLYLARQNISASLVGIGHLQDFLKAPMYAMAGDKPLHRVLRKIGSDPVMEDVQNEFFLEEYMKPSRRWADRNGFTLPLSMLVIYDSFIQSGSIPSWIRRRFRAVPPAKGGNEREWVRQYVNSRHQWLKYWGDGKSRKSKAIRASRYRTRALLEELSRENWNLNKLPMSVNGITV